ncbi:MAG: hypothetical protein VYB72_02265, partial [Planctomycetota bacterium]|nr:hypothetical protein [Planctomycetota bacterium]
MQTLPLVHCSLFAVIFGAVSSSGNILGHASDTGNLETAVALSLYFPGEEGQWETVDAEVAGWNQSRLNALLDWAGEQRSSSVLILWQGRILAEKHWGKVSGATSRGYP